MFAMFGATAYEDSPLFSTFSAAMYTMFITLCLDGWNDLVDETESLYPDSTSIPPKLFFICFIFVLVYILVPVFVAAILDGYRTAAYAQVGEQNRANGRKLLEEFDIVPTFSYDAILHGLLACASREQLHERLSVLFQVVDTDESGSVSFNELQVGFRKIIGQTAESLSIDEFEAITGGDAYLDEQGGMDCDNFIRAMEAQLRQYCRRKLSQYMLAIGDEEPGQEMIMFALQLILSDSEPDVTRRKSKHRFM